MTPEKKEKTRSQLEEFCIHAAELGDGILFGLLHENRFLFNETSGEWLVYSGHKWELDLTGEAQKAVEYIAVWYSNRASDLAARIDRGEKDGDKTKIEQLKAEQRLCNKKAKKLRTQRGRQACLHLAHTNYERPLQVSGDALDLHPMRLACTDGVIDLETGELRPGRPQDLITLGSPTNWHGLHASAPNFERTINEIVDDPEVSEFLQRFFGYCCTGLVTESALVVLEGQGRNGKTLLVETLAHVLGPLAGSIPSEMLLDQGRFTNADSPTPSLMSLRGLRCAFASEVEENRRFSSSRVKWLSGSDSLVGRFPHDRRPTRFRPTHKLILLINERPNAPMNDYAFWERLHMVPFPFSFVDHEPKAANERRADKSLAEKLKEEAPGILAWLVRGCLKWQKQGLSPPEKIRKNTEEYKRSEDLLETFLDEHCILDPKEEEASADLYDAFKSWWSENVSRKTLSQKKFGRLMGRKFERKKTNTIKYVGLRLVKI
ncbi:phage/plasmid primase, P4 family, C-terminal domain protein [delta proteobacterium NaphS2]|nr:phage/plasmid primase, P4 family, C-terminal domain protein [delta proteobacterium NaphS2]